MARRWFIARCEVCTPPLKMPFRERLVRDAWATGHTEGNPTHTVERFEED